MHAPVPLLRRPSAYAAQVLKRDVDLKAVIDEFGRLIYEEMDYVAEALNADKFQELYGDMEGIKVPKVHWKYTRRKVYSVETAKNNLPADNVETVTGLRQIDLIVNAFAAGARS